MIILTAKIYISEDKWIDIDRSNLLAMESSIFDRSDLKMPSFGIISNVGNIEFGDSDGRVLRYAEELKLQEGQKCEIWLTNTLVEEASQLIATMQTNEWDYDNDARTVSVSLKDNLEEWQEIQVKGLYLDIDIPILTIREIYKHLYSITKKQGYDIQGFTELDANTKEVFNTKSIAYPIIKEGTLWQVWTNFCNAFLTQIYVNPNGRICCKYEGGG